MTWWTLVAAVWVAVFAGCVAGWRLRGSVQQRGRGGMLDLTPVAGELDMDWSDARPEIRYDYRPEVFDWSDTAEHRERIKSLAADIAAARRMTLDEARAYVRAGLA